MIAPLNPGVVGVNEAELVRKISHQSFFEFVKEFWHVVVPEDPLWNWHIPYLCDTFQADAERVFEGKDKLHDTIVNISPGSTKSTILSIMAPAWIHARHPEMRVLAASHTQTLTFELGRKCRMVEESDLYRKAFPEVVPSKDQWTKSLFINTKMGGRMAATVGGMSPTGFHAHFILVDDPLDPQKISSQQEIETANNFMAEVLPTRKVDKGVVPTWLIMQRLHQNDCTGYMLKKGKGNIRHICIPAVKSTRVRPLSLRRKYVDGLMDPVRLNRQVLNESEKDLGAFAYAGQFGQHPVPRGGGMFKVVKIDVADRAPRKGPRGSWVQRVRFWDKAGTKDGGAYTVGFLMGRWRPANAADDGSEDEWWILDIVREQYDAAEREKMIKQIAKMDGRDVIVGIEQEPGSGGKESAQLTVRRLAGHIVKVVPAVGSKEDRADAWATMVNGDSFTMVKANWNHELFEEMRYFPQSQYKDQVDAGEGAFTILAKPVQRVGARRINKGR